MQLVGSDSLTDIDPKDMTFGGNYILRLMGSETRGKVSVCTCPVQKMQVLKFLPNQSNFTS